MSITILDVACTRAAYRTADEVTLRLRLSNTGTGPAALRARVVMMRLAAVEAELDLDLGVLPPGQSSHDIILHPRADTYASYGVDMVVEAGGVRVACATAFDVMRTGTEVVRYGFLSRFAAPEPETDLDFLCRLHVTHVQLYDWMYRHDTLLPPQDRFTDPMGKPMDMGVVRDKIRGCHQRGMRAMAYAAVYAATRAFWETHSAWGLYDGAGRPFCLIDRFFIMDIARGSPWTHHFLGQLQAARAEMGVDGFHLDSYGFPRWAMTRGDATGAPAMRTHAEDFPALIHAARAALGPDCTLVFNNVNGWPLEETAAAPQDALYVEVWPPHVRYRDLAELVRRARRAAGTRPVVMAAYLSPFRTEPGSDDACRSALFLMCALAGLGAQHLLFGEENGVLTQGYYVDFSPLPRPFLPQLTRYADFLVRWSEVLRDPHLVDVTATHLGGDFPEYTLEGARVSCWAEAGSVWPVIRESRDRVLVTLVNLCGMASDGWNEGKPRSAPVPGLTLELAAYGGPPNAWWAAPETEGGKPQPLDCVPAPGAQGARWRLVLPALDLFGMVVIQRRLH